MSWERVTRPVQYGGLGILYLERFEWALQMKWLWLQKIEPNKPWNAFNIQVPNTARALFELSVVTEVGDGATTKFWTDKWINGCNIQELAPELLANVKKGASKSRTVQ